MDSPDVRRAVIPAAGRGKRMLSVTNGNAKELLSVGGLSVLAHGLHDLARSGIVKALIVTSPAKPEIKRTFGAEYAGIRLTYVEQPEQKGLGDAISLAESFCAGKPFVCWLPDNLWVGSSASAQLIAALEHAPQSHIVALIKVAPRDVERYGTAGFVESSPLAGNARQISLVYPKGTRSAGGFKGFPLDLYQPDIFDRIRAQRSRQTEGELDDTPILQDLAREGRLVGVVLKQGRLYDCGIPAGFAAAQAALGP